MTRSVALERLVIAVVPLLTVWGIWSYGLWDPWELDLAGAARLGRVSRRARRLSHLPAGVLLLRSVSAAAPASSR